VADPAVVASMLSVGTKPYIVETGLVAREHPQLRGRQRCSPRRAGGHLATCRSHGIALHLDGARLANAHVATGVPLADYGRLFDTVSLCLSKGLGAPVGSVLVASREAVARARVQRKRLGGGWRQAGILAAAGLYALEHHVARLADDHAAAMAFAESVAERTGVLADAPTNIVVLATGDRSPAEVVAAARSRGVALFACRGSCGR
jgi:threonine aldolase